MTPDQKMQAMKALISDDPNNVAVYMRHPGQWYCLIRRVDIKKGGILRSVRGEGIDPIRAVEAAWDDLTKLSDDEYLVLNPHGSRRRAVLWNGFMWEDVLEPHAAEAR